MSQSSILGSLCIKTKHTLSPVCVETMFKQVLEFRHCEMNFNQLRRIAGLVAPLQPHASLRAPNCAWKTWKGMQSHALLFKGLWALQKDVICVATGCEWAKVCAVNMSWQKKGNFVINKSTWMARVWKSKCFCILVGADMTLWRRLAHAHYWNWFTKYIYKKLQVFGKQKKCQWKVLMRSVCVCVCGLMRFTECQVPPTLHSCHSGSHLLCCSCVLTTCQSCSSSTWAPNWTIQPYGSKTGLVVAD